MFDFGDAKELTDSGYYMHAGESVGMPQINELVRQYIDLAYGGDKPDRG
jgi:hypothetical protein